MRHIYRIVLAITLLCLSGTALAQTDSYSRRVPSRLFTRSAAGATGNDQNLGALSPGILYNGVVGGVSTLRPATSGDLPVSELVISPKAGSSHADQITAALAANAGVRVVRLARGTTWTIDKPIVFVSNAELDVGGPSVTLNSTMPYVDGHTSIVFSAPIPAGQLAAVTTVAVDAVVGATTITVADATNIPIGGYIEILGVAAAGKLDAYGFSYLVKNKAGAVVTIDRPLLKPFWAPASVRVYTPVKNVQIRCNGARITGTGDRGAQFVGTWYSSIDGCRFEMRGMQAAAAFDWGGRGNRFSNLYVDGGGNSSTGIAIEGQEDSGIYDSVVVNTAAPAFYVNACGRWTLRGNRAANGVGNSTAGVIIGGDIGVQTGSTDGVLDDFQSTNYGIGVSLRDGSSNVLVSRVIVRGSVVGGVYCDVTNGAALPSTNITFDGLNIQNAAYRAIYVASGCSGFQIRNLVTSGNQTGDGSGGILELGAETSVTGWRLSETATAGASVVKIIAAATITLRDVVGTLSKNGYSDFVSATENATVYLNGYDVTRAATATHTGALLDATAGKTVRFVTDNGVNVGWSYFCYLQAGHTIVIGPGVVSTGTVTTAAGTKTTVNTTTN